MTYILFITGFVVLILGAKWLIRGAAEIGKKSGLSQLVIGLTIVALGTSLPELIINVFASVNGRTGLAIGNVIGSNIINTLMIIGVAAVVNPIRLSSNRSMFDVIFSIVVTIVLFIAANLTGNNSISRYEALLFIVILALYLWYSVTRKGFEAEINSDQLTLTAGRSILYIVAGIAGLYFGGRWIVNGAELISNDLGISQSVVGLTIIAGATSLPELFTSVIAARQGNTELAVGNAIGSNIFNILLVLGVSALIRPIPFEYHLNAEIYILLLSTLLIILFIKIDFGRINRAISRVEGILLICAYILFIIFTFLKR